MKRFRGGLVFKAHRLVYHSTLDLGVTKKKKYRHAAFLHQQVSGFRGGLAFKAHRLLYHSTQGLRVIEKKKEYRHAAFLHQQVLDSHPPGSIVKE